MKCFNNMPEISPTSNKTILSFTIKLSIILLFIFTFFNILLPDFSDIHSFISSKNKIISEKINEKQNQFYLLGLIQNPAALYRSSEVHESTGRLDKAIRDMDLAIGLLELHGASPTVIERYAKRLNSLNKQKDSKQ